MHLRESPFNQEADDGQEGVHSANENPNLIKHSKQQNNPVIEKMFERKADKHDMSQALKTRASKKETEMV